MIANPDQFQAITSSKKATYVTHKLRIYENEIETTKSVKLLEVEVDFQIKFNDDLRYVVKR